MAFSSNSEESRGEKNVKRDIFIQRVISMEKRREQRIPATRPVQLESGTGVTLNISSSGIFFETDVNYAEGGEISFAIEIDGVREEKMLLRARGVIVRIDRSGGKVGIAVQIVNSSLDAAI
jgi:hypothetical protein